MKRSDRHFRLSLLLGCGSLVRVKFVGNLRLIVLASCAAIVLPAEVPAAILMQYNFPASNTWDSSDTDADSAASVFTFSGMGTLTADHGRSTAGGAPNLNTIFTRGGVLTTSEANAVAAADFYSFTLTPNVGSMAGLSNLTFVTDATYGATVSYTANFFIRSSIDGFASNITAFSDGPGTSGTAFNARSVDLTGAAFQNLSSAVEFRVYLFHTGTDALNTNAITRSDTYVLNGTMSPVPEPSVGVFGGLAALIIGALRRREGTSEG